MQNNKFFRMLGLAARARKLNFGEGAVRDSVRTKLAKMVIVAQDASDNTKKKLSDNCKFYKTPYFEYGDRFTLGGATGKGFAVVISVNDENFAKTLINILQDR